MSARRRKRKKSSDTNPSGAKPQETTVLKPPRPKLSRRRKWLFRLTTIVLSPVLFFTLLEIGLRLGGYGYPTAYFLGPDSEGNYATNYRFGWRFFPRSLARKVEPNQISAKPAGTVRIFVLGSSAAQGVPDPFFGFGRILEVMLRDRYPGVRFEVVNAAMTAINSHVVLEIARDCAAHQPDLFVVYMGNNEVVGPYGPGTVFQQWSPSLRFIRSSIWVKSTRVGQWVGDLIGAFGSKKGPPATWRGMEMFMGNQIAADDPRLASVYGNFRQNLLDICDVARRAGAGVVLSTVAVNLQDCPPLASLHRSDLSAEELTKWESLYRAGVELESGSQCEEAVERYKAAARIDGRFAELQFRLGRCLSGLGRSAKARERFVSARDLDVLRFRADSQINAVIREVAVEKETAGILFADAEEAMGKSDAVPDGIPGKELFYEHVHLTFDGNYELARIIFDQVEAAFPKLAASRKQGPILSKQQSAESLALTSWDEYHMAANMAEITSRPPFTNQLDHADRQASARERVKKLGRLGTTPKALKEACKQYQAALEKSPSEWQLHYRLGNLAIEISQPETAIDHLKIVIQKLPWSALAHNDLGKALDKCGRFDAAISQYQKTLEIEPENATAHFNLGITLANCGRVDQAIAQYQQALKIDPNLPLAHNNLGLILIRCGRIDEAMAHFQQALEIDPELAMAHVNIGNILSNKGRADEAIAHFQKALEIDPELAMAHNNLGLLLSRRGRIDEAVAHFQTALEIDPQFAMAHINLGVYLFGCGKIDEAIAHYRKALETEPRSVIIHNNLGIALSRQGQIDEAVGHFQKALEIKPDFTEARKNLEHALKIRDAESGRK
jgi:tetratricopeptide (TPR) repeat protein